MEKTSMLDVTRGLKLEEKNPQGKSRERKGHGEKNKGESPRQR